jgi:hypothetical protein
LAPAGLHPVASPTDRSSAYSIATSDGCWPRSVHLMDREAVERKVAACRELRRRIDG